MLKPFSGEFGVAVDSFCVACNDCTDCDDCGSCSHCGGRNLRRAAESAIEPKYVPTPVPHPTPAVRKHLKNAANSKKLITSTVTYSNKKLMNKAQRTKASNSKKLISLQPPEFDKKNGRRRLPEGSDIHCDKKWWGFGLSGGITKFRIVHPGGGLYW